MPRFVTPSQYLYCRFIKSCPKSDYQQSFTVFDPKLYRGKTLVIGTDNTATQAPQTDKWSATIYDCKHIHRKQI